MIWIPIMMTFLLLALAAWILSGGEGPRHS